MKYYLNTNLKILRKKNNESQSDIASLLGKAPNTIGNWETSISEPSISELLILIKHFEISLDDIVIKDLSKAVQDEIEVPEFWKELKRLKEDVEQLKKQINRK